MILFWASLAVLVLGVVLHLFHAPRSHVGRVLVALGLVGLVLWILFLAACAAAPAIGAGVYDQRRQPPPDRAGLRARRRPRARPSWLACAT